METQENRYSREYLLKEANNHALGIKFKHGSTSYNEHGADIVITKIHDEDNKLLENMLSQPPINTSGEITVTILNTDTLGNTVITFDTDDILNVAICG